jgi:ATP synthase alpha/beta chain, C terminal domain
VAVLYAGTQGFIDKVPVARVREWEAGFVRFLKSEEADLLSEIEKKKALDDPLFERLKAAISTFNHQFGVEVAQGAPAANGSTTPPAAKAEAKAQAPAAKAEPNASEPAAKAEPKVQAPTATAEPKAQAPTATAEPKASEPAAKAEPKVQAPTATAEPKAQAPTATAEPAAAAPAAKVEQVQREQPSETEADPERPSQLNQIRAALADTPTKAAPDLEPGAAPKPKRPPRKPKAS